MDWPFVSIGDLVTEFRGGAPLKPSDFTDTGVKVLPKGGVGRKGWLDIEDGDLQYCSSEYAERHHRNSVDEKYTIVVLRDLVPSGPSIGLMVQIEHSDKYVLAQGVYGFKLKEGIAPGFLVQLSHTSWYRKLANSIMVGSTQVHITNTAFKSVQIPLPPFPEQEAINQALSDADALIESLEQVLAKKRHLKQGTMQELLTGKERLPGFSGAWEVKLLLSLATIAQGQVDPKDSPYCSMALIGPEHVESGTGKLLARRTALEQGAISGKYLFKAGDVVYGKINPYLRKAFLADFDGLCSADMYPLRPVEGVSPGFLLAIILGSEFSKYAELVSARSGIPKINRDELAGFTIRVPMSLEEQTAIAAIFSDMDAEIAELESQLAKTGALKQGMMQKLLTGEIRLI